MSSFIQKVNTIANWQGLFVMGVVPFGTTGQEEFEMEPNTDPGTKSTYNTFNLSPLISIFLHFSCLIKKNNKVPASSTIALPLRSKCRLWREDEQFWICIFQNYQIHRWQLNL